MLMGFIRTKLSHSLYNVYYNNLPLPTLWSVIQLTRHSVVFSYLISLSVQTYKEHSVLSFYPYLFMNIKHHVLTHILASSVLLYPILNQDFPLPCVTSTFLTI